MAATSFLLFLKINLAHSKKQKLLDSVNCSLKRGIVHTSLSDQQLQKFTISASSLLLLLLCCCVVCTFVFISVLYVKSPLYFFFFFLLLTGWNSYNHNKCNHTFSYSPFCYELSTFWFLLKDWVYVCLMILLYSTACINFPCTKMVICGSPHEIFSCIKNWIKLPDILWLHLLGYSINV